MTFNRPNGARSVPRYALADRFVSRFAVLALFLFSTVPALAVAPDDPPAEPAVVADELEPVPPKRFEDQITVTGKAEPSLTQPSLAAATAAVEEVPGGASVVDSTVFRRGRASTLKDALEMAPGVMVQPRFGAEEARLSIRGSGLQRTFHGRGIKLLQDGVPLNLGDGSFDFQAVEPLAARYIEVFRGPNGLALGSATLGGAINYVSPSGYDASPWLGRLEGGAFGYQRGQASAGFSRDGFDGFAAVTHSAQDGFRDHAEQEAQRLFANFGRRFSERIESRLLVSAVRTDSELPGSLTRAQLRSDATQAAAGNLALDQKRDFDLFRISQRTSFRGDASRFDVSVFGSWKELDHPIFQVIDQKSQDFGVDLRWERDAAIGSRSNRLVVGLSPTLGQVRDRRFVNVAGHRGAPTSDGDTLSTNFDLYLEDRLEIRPSLHLTGGVVVSRSVRDFDDRFLTDGNQTDRETYSGTSPKLGLLWEVADGRTLFASVGKSFEAPTFGELVPRGGGLLDLDAQRATTIEAGTRGRSNGRLPASWEAVLYSARLDGELLSLNDAAGNPLGTINAGSTRHEGLELGGELRSAPRGQAGLSLRGVYTWSRFRFDGDPTFGDRQLAGLPEHFGRLDLLWESAAGWYAGPSYERASRSPIDHANTLFADAYGIWGAKLGWRREKGLAVFVEAKNLTDEAYAATTGVVADARGRDSAQFLPGDGASVFFGIEVRP